MDLSSASSRLARGGPSSSPSPLPSSPSTCDADFDTQFAAHCLIAMSNSRRPIHYFQKQQPSSYPSPQTSRSQLIKIPIPSASNMIKRNNHPSGGSAGDSSVSSRSTESSNFFLTSSNCGNSCNFGSCFNPAAGGGLSSSPSPSSSGAILYSLTDAMNLMPVDLSFGGGSSNRNIHQQQQSMQRVMIIDPNLRPRSPYHLKPSSTGLTSPSVITSPIILLLVFHTVSNRRNQ